MIFPTSNLFQKFDWYILFQDFVIVLRSFISCRNLFVTTVVPKFWRRKSCSSHRIWMFPGVRYSDILRFAKWMRMKTARRTDRGQHLIFSNPRTNFGNDILWLSALLVSFVCTFLWGLWDVVRFWWYDFRAPKKPCRGATFRGLLSLPFCVIAGFNHRYVRKWQETSLPFRPSEIAFFFSRQMKLLTSCIS